MYFALSLCLGKTKSGGRVVIPFVYLRPDGVSTYKRPDAISTYKRP